VTAFTTAEKTLIYEIMELMQGTTYTWVDYGVHPTISSVPFSQELDFSTATTLVNTAIAAIEAASDGRQARLVTLLGEYNDVATDVATVQQGGGASTTGARYDPRHKRARLKAMIELHIGIAIRKRGWSDGDTAARTARSGSVLR
jgi:hypothetical protein